MPLRFRISLGRTLSAASAAYMYEVAIGNLTPGAGGTDVELSARGGLLLWRKAPGKAGTPAESHCRTIAKGDLRVLLDL